MANCRVRRTYGTYIGEKFNMTGCRLWTECVEIETSNSMGLYEYFGAMGSIYGICVNELVYGATATVRKRILDVRVIEKSTL